MNSGTPEHRPRTSLRVVDELRDSGTLSDMEIMLDTSIQINTNITNKTGSLDRTSGSKNEPNIVLRENRSGTKTVKTCNLAT